MSRFQTFDESTSPANGAERIKKLRAELARRGYDGYIVPAPMSTRANTFRRARHGWHG